RSADAEGLPARYRPLCRPVLAGLDRDEKVELAARVLRAMGLQRGLAPLVVFVGHGSQSANNAQAAALDCGACCGQSGEVNARVLARLLNEPAVREGLRRHGIDVPAQTVFVAALHNTTTDEVTAFDLDLHGAPVHERWARLQDAFELAADRVRRERAPVLGLDPRAAQARLLE
ncbi:putative inorganic carbon transporter subunit DabA, partial [Rubrivivax gelatinosus]